MPTTEFYNETDWQGSSTPYVNRVVPLASLWPQGAGASKDTLEAGMHPMLAIGPIGDRGNNLVGVVVDYDEDADLAEMNIGRGFVSKQYIANVLTYSAGDPATWSATLTLGQIVYLDDSTDLAAGVTLSLSPLNESGAANPIAGVVAYLPEEIPDTAQGGWHTDPYPKAFTGNDATYYVLAGVMLF